MGHLVARRDIRQATPSYFIFARMVEYRKAGEQTRPRGTMSNPIHIRMGGYGPATTGFSRALKLIGDRLAGQIGGPVAHQICLEHHGPGLPGRRHIVAGGAWAADARLSIEQLSDRPRSGARLR